LTDDSTTGAGTHRTPDPPAIDRLEIGRVNRAHGLNGEVQVTLVSDRTDRLDPGSRLLVGGREMVVASARPHQQRWLVQFEGVADRAAAEALRGAVLQAEPDDEDAEGLWAHQVIGAEVVTADGRQHGKVAAIVANPAHDLLELESGALVPAVFVVEERSGPGRLVIDPPPGLLDN
jgi:16S rRNA processing protein RimM